MRKLRGMLRGTWKRLALAVLVLGILPITGWANPVVPSKEAATSRGLQVAKRLVQKLKLKPPLSRAHQQATHLVRKHVARDRSSTKAYAPKKR